MNPVLPNRHLLDVDPRRLSMINAANMSAAGHPMHQRRTSIINYHQHRNSQLRKSSFTTSILSLAVTDEEASDLSVTRLSISNSLTSVHKQCEDEDAEATNKLLDIGRVASWAVGFEKLLNDEMGLYVFTEFLKKEFSQENIQFWTECEKLKKYTDLDEVRSKANMIWSTYLHDTDDGSCRINIDSRTRQECYQSLLHKPNAHIFEKAQSQIFQLMKLDSYTRFLKSNMYKECIMSEMEGKSIPYTKPSPPPPTNNEDRSKGNDSLGKIKDEEKKDKKRSPLIPWTKAFIKWKRLSVKRDTSSSSSSIPQTANASTNTSFYDNCNKSASVELTPTLNFNKIPSTASSMSLQSPTKPPLIPIGYVNKITKINQQESSLANLINRDLMDKKLLNDYSSIDTSRFCRFMFPDSTSAVVLTAHESQSIRHAIDRLFAKRGITWYRTELYTADQQRIDLQDPLSSLSGKEIHVESRILLRLDFPNKTICVRCDPKRTLLKVLQPVFEKFRYSMRQYVFYANDSLVPLNVNELVGCYDNQRIFAVEKTASLIDSSSQQKNRTTSDIFDMISENDEDINFDEYGILKVVTQTKATIVVSTDDCVHLSTPEVSPSSHEYTKTFVGSKR